jgi:hypothetical protein
MTVRANITTPPPRALSEIGRYPWRRAHGLLVISDYVTRFNAVHRPSGPYAVALPTDRLGGRDANA